AALVVLAALVVAVARGLVVWVRVWPAVTAGPGVLGVRPAWVARPVPVASAVLRVWPVPVVMVVPGVVVALVIRVRPG
ncbi:hypothetical protein, partial [Mycobacterium marinum]|uniref:hypothetical protein n=1 Tax=Mycobacterium marinum TaxID=1781 RepID=UPI0035695992